jgi:formate dehydrogenase iron-sulfur subunit
MPKALLYDATRCIGCLACEGACAETNQLPYDDAIAAEKRTSDHKYTFVMVKNEDKYLRRMCQHCLDPACVSACPVGALQKTAAGPVIYEESRCMGCRYCMVACPFGMPKYEWSKLLPKVRKCILCPDRIAAGKPTSCTEACPAEATLTGERDELIAEAHRRIAEKPDQYVDHVYGEKEVGGTSVLMLSSIPFESFGLPMSLGEEPLPHRTADVIRRIPDVATVGWAVLGGVWWISQRKNEIASIAKAKDAVSERPEDNR